jgi:hypothetical protein
MAIAKQPQPASTRILKHGSALLTRTVLAIKLDIAVETADLDQVAMVVADKRVGYQVESQIWNQVQEQVDKW